MRSMQFKWWGLCGNPGGREYGCLPQKTNIANPAEDLTVLKGRRVKIQSYSLRVRWGISYRQ